VRGETRAQLGHLADERRKEAQPPALGDVPGRIAREHRVVDERLLDVDGPRPRPPRTPAEHGVFAEVALVNRRPHAGAHAGDRRERLETADAVRDLAPHRQIRGLEQWRVTARRERAVERPARDVGYGPDRPKRDVGLGERTRERRQPLGTRLAVGVGEGDQRRAGRGEPGVP